MARRAHSTASSSTSRMRCRLTGATRGASSAAAAGGALGYDLAAGHPVHEAQDGSDHNAVKRGFGFLDGLHRWSLCEPGIGSSDMMGTGTAVMESIFGCCWSAFQTQKAQSSAVTSAKDRASMA